MKDLTDRMINNEVDYLTNIYELSNGQKNYLLLDSSTSLSEIYCEAVYNDCYVKIDDSYKSCLIVTVDNEPKLTVVVRHLLSHLQHTDTPFVKYSGNHDIVKLRATVSRVKREFDFGKLTVRGCTGDVSIYKSDRNKSSMEKLTALLDEFGHKGKPFRIEISVFTSLESLRSAIQHYSTKNDCKFKTRVSGPWLEVVKIEQYGYTLRDTKSNIDTFLKSMKYDSEIAIPYESFPNLSKERVKALLRNTGGKSYSFSGDFITRHKFIVVKDSGKYCLLHKGENVYSTNSNELTSIDRAYINTYLKNHGYVMLGRKVQKVTL